MTYVIIDGRGIIPDRVTKIDNSAFENCTRLETIVIPDSAMRASHISSRPGVNILVIYHLTKTFVI